MLQKFIIPTLFISLIGCATDPVVSSYQDSIGQRYSNSPEEQLVIDEANKLSLEIESKGLIETDSDSDLLVEEISSRLVPDLGTRESFDIYIIRSPEINAFAIGNSSVYVHSGIFSVLENEHQFAALLAHEIAHVKQRHAVKKLINRKQTVSSAKIANFFTLGFASYPAITSLAQNSRAHEVEADRMAAELIHNAGFEVSAITKMLENFNQVSGNKNDGRGIWATHPSSEERINELNGRIVELNKEAAENDRELPLQLKELYTAVRVERIQDNIKMRLRARQYQLAIQDLDILDRYAVDLGVGNRDYYRGQAHLGMATHTKSAAKELAIIELGKPTKWSRYIGEVEGQVSHNLTTAKEYFAKSLEQNPNLRKAMLGLADVSDRLSDRKAAQLWYEKYRDSAETERDREYAQRLLNKVNEAKEIPDSN